MTEDVLENEELPGVQYYWCVNCGNCGNFKTRRLHVLKCEKCESTVIVGKELSEITNTEPWASKFKDVL